MIKTDQVLLPSQVSWRGRLSSAFERHSYSLMLAPAVIVLVALAIFPFIYSLWLSFNSWNLADRKGAWEFIGLANYINILFKDPFFWSSVRATALFVGFSVGIEMVLGIAIAMLLNRNFPLLGIVRTLVILPVMTTPVVVGLIWRFMYNPDRGIINYLLSQINIKGLDWLARESTAMPAVILVDVWEWTPFVVLIVMAALQAIPTEPLEAALIDGATAWQRFKFVIFPLILPSVTVALLIRLMDAFKAFDIIYVLTLGGPGVSTQVMSLYAYKYGFKFFQMGYAAALAYIMVVAVTVLSNSLIKRAIRK